MNYPFTSSIGYRRSLFIWSLFCIVSGATFLVYALVSEVNGRGEMVMPLDDVYIHFQYARQLALGQPYVYNPGLPATSGATSFMYPFLLAVGYVIGFQGLRLGLWAMGISAMTMAYAQWQVYQNIRRCGGAEWLGVVIALGFGLNGAVAWHFMSAMETGWVMLFTLGTLQAVCTLLTNNTTTSLRGVVIWATALALIRPEGGLFAAAAMMAVGWREWRQPIESRRDRHWWLARSGLLIPIGAIGIQPLVNVIFTGSAVASGNAAKSVLGEVPFYWDDVIRRIVGNFVRIGVEFMSGGSSREGLYILPLLFVLALVGIGWLLFEQKLRPLGIMLLVWLAGGAFLLATLDTVFWHFKRYQMPLVALLFPLSGWGIGAVIGHFRVESRKFYVVRLVITVMPTAGMFIVAAITSLQFLRYYDLNVGYVYAQPLQMAEWLETHTPENAVIAVHDVGMMRYMGGRTTLDMVGLTTRGAADFWRNGPGAVAQFLMQEKPDYIASYGNGHGYGLGMIANTAIYGEPLAGFPVALDGSANVALAADFQGIYKPNWQSVLNAGGSMQESYPFRSKSPLGRIDVGNIVSEKDAHYVWRDNQRLDGFPTEVHEFDYINCVDATCHAVDGGRLITGDESFDIPSGNGEALALVTRLHPQNVGTFDVYANGKLIGRRWIPEIAGNWLEVATCIPQAITSFSAPNEPIHIQIVPHMGAGFYMPYYHWVYKCPGSESDPLESMSQFEDGAIQLTTASLVYHPETSTLDVHLKWYSNGQATGDYKVFVHVYADLTQPPVAQMDMRPGNGTLPPGNWLPGVLEDTITVDLTSIPSGHYQVAIGMYDPVTFERLQPAGGDVQKRLLIGEVEISG